MFSVWFRDIIQSSPNETMPHTVPHDGFKEKVSDMVTSLASGSPTALHVSLKTPIDRILATRIAQNIAAELQIDMPSFAVSVDGRPWLAVPSDCDSDISVLDVLVRTQINSE